jgi:hypothetical protein
MVSVTYPYGRIFGFLDRSRYFFFQVAPQLYTRGWVDAFPDSLLLRKSSNARNRTRTSGSLARWPLVHRGGMQHPFTGPYPAPNEPNSHSQIQIPKINLNTISQPMPRPSPQALHLRFCVYISPPKTHTRTAAFFLPCSLPLSNFALHYHSKTVLAFRSQSFRPNWLKKINVTLIQTNGGVLCMRLGAIKMPGRIIRNRNFQTFCVPAMKFPLPVGTGSWVGNFGKGNGYNSEARSFRTHVHIFFNVLVCRTHPSIPPDLYNIESVNGNRFIF